MPDPEGNTPDLRIGSHTASGMTIGSEHDAARGITPASALSVEPEPAKERALTRYEISLACASAQIDENAERGHAWRPLGIVEASSGQDAIRRWYASDPNLTGNVRLRAVPSRNVTELDVVVEQVTAVKFT